MKKNLEISVRVKNIPRHASTMALSASGTKRDETKKDTKRTCRPSLQKHKKIIDKERMNKLPRDIILIISKMHPLIIPPFTNKTLRRAVKDYLAGGDRKKRIVEKYGEISTWDVSNVTNMAWMFAEATSFNQPLNNWNVSNVLDMSQMFASARSFNQPLDKWNVSNVCNMRSMFGGATSFNQPLNNWNVSKVREMNCMFQNATSFNQPLNKWNVSKLWKGNMGKMFWNADSFNQPLHAPWYHEESESE